MGNRNSQPIQNSIDDSNDQIKKITQEISNIFNNEKKELHNLNIMLIGETGVGKSTLTNNIFRGKVAMTGIGKPVTKHIRSYTKKDFPLTIYDTPGIELNSKKQEELKKEITKIIKDRNIKGDINESIHCILYCINTQSERFQEYDREFIKSFKGDESLSQIPIIVVLTQSYNDNISLRLKSYIESFNLNIVQVIPVVAEQYQYKIGDQEGTVDQKGLSELIEVIDNCLPEIMKDTLHNVQIASIKQKRKRAKSTIAGFTASAFAIGAVPLSFADCLLLVPNEILMIVRITKIYGVDFHAGFITSFVCSTIGSGTATLLGRYAVSNILKLIPGVGQIIGGLISGSFAGILTNSLGMAYIPIIEAVYKKEVNYDSFSNKDFKDFVNTKFEESLLNYKNRIQDTDTNESI